MKLQLARRAAAARRTELALDEQPPADQLRDSLRHNRPSQPSGANNLRARAESAVAHMVEDRKEAI
jgi:hypothetical protein